MVIFEIFELIHGYNIRHKFALRNNEHKNRVKCDRNIYTLFGFLSVHKSVKLVRVNAGIGVVIIFANLLHAIYFRLLDTEKTEQNPTQTPFVCISSTPDSVCYDRIKKCKGVR